MERVEVQMNRIKDLPEVEIEQCDVDMDSNFVGYASYKRRAAKD